MEDVGMICNIEEGVKMYGRRYYRRNYRRTNRRYGYRRRW